MKFKTIIAGILIVLGMGVLAYSGIPCKTIREPVDVAPLYEKTTESHPIPPVLAVALIGASCCLGWTPGRHDGRDPRPVGGVTR